MMTNVTGSMRGGALAASGISWGWLLALGILMAVLGVVGLGMTYWLTVVAVFWFGILAIIGGVSQILDAFHHSGWKSILWHVVIGVVYVIAGIVLITMPISSAFWLTLFLAIMLVVVGVSRIIMAFSLRGHGNIWLWVALSGVVSIVLGILIYGMVVPPSAEELATPEGQMAWAQSWGWVIGMFVAIELIMEGVALIGIALATKGAGAAAGGSGTAAATAG